MKRIGKTSSGALANLASQVVPFLIFLIATSFLLKSLGRNQYGTLVLFMLFPQIAGQIDWGIGTAATRAFAHHYQRHEYAKARRIFYESTLILCIWGLVLSLVLLLCFSRIESLLGIQTLSDKNEAIAHFAITGSCFLALVATAMSAPLRALELYKNLALLQITTGIVFWLGCILLTLWNFPFVALLCLSFLMGMMSCLAIFFLNWSLIKKQTSNEKITGALAIQPFLRFGVGSFIAQLSSLVTYNADKLLISALLSPAAAGAYTICANVANKILVVIATLATFTFPRTAKLKAAGDETGLNYIYVTTTRLCIVVATALVIPIIVLAHPFLELWLGQNFANENSLALQTLSLGYLLATYSVVASNVTTGMGDSKTTALFAVTGGIVTLGLCFYLAPRFGVFGAALAALIGMAQAVVFNIIIATRLGPSARSASWPLVWQISLVMALITIPLVQFKLVIESWPMLMIVGISICVSFLVLWLVTFGRGHELKIFQKVLSRNDHH